MKSGTHRSNILYVSGEPLPRWDTDHAQTELHPSSHTARPFGECFGEEHRILPLFSTKLGTYFSNIDTVALITMLTII